MVEVQYHTNNCKNVSQIAHKMKSSFKPQKCRLNQSQIEEDLRIWLWFNLGTKLFREFQRKFGGRRSKEEQEWRNAEYRKAYVEYEAQAKQKNAREFDSFRRDLEIVYAEYEARRAIDADTATSAKKCSI